MLNSDERKRPSAERLLNFIYEKDIYLPNAEKSRK